MSGTTACSSASQLVILSAESIPRLEAAVQLCAEASEFAKQRVGRAMTEWWSQPAVDALPWDTCRFATVWLLTGSCLILFQTRQDCGEQLDLFNLAWSV